MKQARVQHRSGVLANRKADGTSYCRGEFGVLSRLQGCAGKLNSPDFFSSAAQPLKTCGKEKNGTFFLYFSYPLFFSQPTFSPATKVPPCSAFPLDVIRANNCLINLPVTRELALESCPVRPACPRVTPSHRPRAITNALLIITKAWARR